MTFPRKARKLTHGFSLLACFTLIITVILQDNITILVNEAESADTIYLQEALECLEFARQQFFQAKNSKEKVSANFLLKRAQARLKVVT